MDRTGVRSLFILASVFICSVLIQGGPVSAHDEVFYLSGQAGLSIPSFSPITFTGSYTPGSTADKFETSNSVLYGFKAGMYSKAGILGVETEVFQTHPNMKQQQVFVQDPAGNTTDTIAGKNARVTTWAFNIIGRVPVNDRVQVYAGIGPAIFFSRIRSLEFSQTSTKPGLNTQLGLNYFLTPHVQLFGEWKFNYTQFDYATVGNVNAVNHVAGFNANYTAHNIVFGVSYLWDVALPFRAPFTLREVFSQH